MPAIKLTNSGKLISYSSFHICIIQIRKHLKPNFNPRINLNSTNPRSKHPIQLPHQQLRSIARRR